jgi:hypothetical protein
MAVATGTAILGAAALTAGAGIYGASQARGAASAQQQAAQQASDVQRQIFERQVELQEPFREAGLAGQNRLLQLLGLGEDKTAPGFGKYATAEFGMDKFQADPGYAFRMSEGMKALERSAAARGGLLSGATLKGTQRYGQDLASQEYQNAFNRYQAERAGTLNPFQALAGTAQTSANVLGGQAGVLGGQLGSNIIGAGNAAAAGRIGAANAIVGGLGQGLNFYQNQQILNRLIPGGGIGGGMAGPEAGYYGPGLNY